MNYVIKRAKTVDEAVSEALKELNLKKDEVKIEIIEEPSKGFLGLIGSKEATVKVSKIQKTSDILKEIFNNSHTEKSQVGPKRDEFENKEEIIEEVQKTEEVEEVISVENEEVQSLEDNQEIDKIIREFLDKILKNLDLDYELEIEKKDRQIDIEIKGDEQKLGIVIGKRGVTLDSIQYILSLLVNKHSDNYIRISLDSSGYRQRRRETLKELAEKMAAKVLSTNRSIRLEPMNALDRKIIHEALQDYEGVITHSEGKDPFRKVVIQKERKY
ncbi:RNA-binding cell elongation regulator Jag/EloR [Peptoniphilus catoniae]|uniref:RNA-binding cell elongation regulator Jag/EloR n=1 Tax=Peptoniphilus catoniae TaxID=1660341 RepID=UPI0010FD4DDA|nr:RNA-binding cell elongation regulator Jag/EloR [Peptoniphilus catoniae]